MRILYMLLIMIFVPNAVVSQNINFKEKTIRFCAGTHEWPPYYFYKRINGEKTKEVIGLDIDIFNEVFTKNGINYSVKLLPWKRCLLSSKQGKKYDVIFGGSLNENRRANYVTTKGYYNLTPSYFYAKKAFPNGITIKQSLELGKQGKLCGLRGFNYINFGQKNEDIDMGSADYKSLVTKTIGQRCKISFARYEILEGWGKLLKRDFTTNENLVFTPIPNNPLESFHLMISKNYPYAQELKAFFEEEIKKLKHSGKLNEILNNKKSRP